MGLLHSLRRERTLLRWLAPARWVRNAGKAIWAAASCLFLIGLVGVQRATPVRCLLLVLCGAAIAIAMHDRAVAFFDLFAIQGISARLYGAGCVVADLALLARH